MLCGHTSWCQSQHELPSSGRPGASSPGHHRAFASAHCIVISPVCGFECGFLCLWVCYHDNSKLRASIFTKLGLWVKVVTFTRWLNFGGSAPPGVCGWEIFLALPYYSQLARSVCVSLSVFSCLCWANSKRIFRLVQNGKYPGREKSCDAWSIKWRIIDPASLSLGSVADMTWWLFCLLCTRVPLPRHWNTLLLWCHRLQVTKVFLCFTSCLSRLKVPHIILGIGV